MHISLWPKAGVYLQGAGAKSIPRSIHAEAVSHYEQALAALGRLPGEDDSSRRIVDMQIELRNALHRFGEFDRALALLQEARAIASSLGDDRRVARIDSFITESHHIGGNYQDAAAAGLSARRVGEAISDLPILAASNFHLGSIHFQQGTHDEAIAFYRSNVEMIIGEQAGQRIGMAGLPATFSRGHIAWSLAEQGQFAEAFAMAREAARIAADAKHPFTEAFAVYSRPRASAQGRDSGGDRRTRGWTETVSVDEHPPRHALHASLS